MTLPSNQIRNFLATKKDMELDEKIFGHDAVALKGKSVRIQPKQMTDDAIAVPKNLMQTHLNTHMCKDVMQMTGVKFLTAIGCPLCYQKTVYLENEKAEAICSSLDKF